MGTKQKLEAGLKDAMKSKNDLIKRTVRLVISAIKMAEIDNRDEINEETVISIVQKEIKSRMESIDAAKTAKRDDLIEEYSSELEVLKTFLPEQLSEEEVQAIVNTVIEETGAQGIKDMGNVMKNTLPRIKGQAPNSIVSKIVKEVLINK
ncbi:MAG: GatB/YqeY domain-containing protein [Bacteroidales bacterium]|nr:GatB/YqeY domain-containing protein [Bacteroidales bacterium]